jgi:hypothetical protein
MQAAEAEALEPQVQPHQRVTLAELEELDFPQALVDRLLSMLVAAVAVETLRVLPVEMVAVVLAAVQPIQGLLALLILVAEAVEMVMGILEKQAVPA